MIDFKLIAGTNIGLRENNEDNFTVCADLAKNDWRIPVNYQEEIKLGDLGSVMVVADGMGGQNAGEVASSIAVETVQSMLAPDVLPKGVTASDDSIDEYLKKVICAADLRVKKMTRENPSTSGMGSTIVIAWVIGHRAHIAWLGDSRAYCIHKDKGIARLSKDHSYVQSLVDAGRITDEQAFTHPDSNIINRSLGDMSQKAKPDVVSIELTEGAVILLCTDGLCGVCQDSVIGGIIEDNIYDLKKCREDLMTAALAAGGSDNITLTMLHVCKTDFAVSDAPHEKKAPNRKKKWNLLIYAVLIAIIGALSFMLFFDEKQQQQQPEPTPDTPIVVKEEQKKTETGAETSQTGAENPEDSALNKQGPLSEPPCEGGKLLKKPNTDGAELTPTLTSTTEINLVANDKLPEQNNLDVADQDSVEETNKGAGEGTPSDNDNK